MTRPLATALIAAALLCAHSGCAYAARDKAKPASTSPEISEKQADLGELRNRIESLRKDLSTSEENKADAADRLRESERRISRLQRELYELAEQRGQLQKGCKTSKSNRNRFQRRSYNSRSNSKICSTGNICVAVRIHSNSCSTATIRTRWHATCSISRQ